MVQHYRNDILMNCDVIHKAMRTDTVYQMMRELRKKDEDNFTNNFKQQLLGQTILCDHNNRTYVIDDVDFNINPLSTFKKGDQDIVIRDYYAQVFEGISRSFSLSNAVLIKLICIFFCSIHAAISN